MELKKQIIISRDELFTIIAEYIRKEHNEEVCNTEYKICGNLESGNFVENVKVQDITVTCNCDTECLE